MSGSQDNIDASQTGGSNSKASLTINGSVRDWAIGFVMALSILVNIMLGIRLTQEYRDKTIAEDLRANDFLFFKQNDWVHLKTDVEVTKLLIAAKCSK